jgi:purine catabolism regulator
MLRDAMEDVALAATRPELVAASNATDRPVRWVHASEQLDIAPLLRGGELILMEGANFAGCTDDQLTEYVDSLFSADVAGLAIETTDRVPVVPPAIVRRAEQRGLPVVRLRRRVPFVQVCESINSQLSAPALRRRTVAERISRLLSTALDADDALGAVLSTLARETRSSAVLLSPGGAELGRVGSGVPRGDLTDFDAAVSYGGERIGTLVLVPDADSDIHLLDAGLSRAPDIVAIALRINDIQTAEERLQARLFALLTSTVHSAVPFDALADRLHLRERDAYLGVVSRGRPVAFESVDTTRIMMQRFGDQRLALLAFDDENTMERARLRLLATPMRHGDTLAVGTGSADRHGIRRCIRAALSACSIKTGTVDARNYELTRFADSVQGAADTYVQEQIKAVLDYDRDRRSALFDTLAAYFTHLGNMTDTARALGVQRQSVYKRMHRVETLLGPVLPGSPRMAALATAVFLEHARRQSYA